LERCFAHRLAQLTTAIELSIDHGIQKLQQPKRTNATAGASAEEYTTPSNAMQAQTGKTIAEETSGTHSQRNKEPGQKPYY